MADPEAGQAAGIDTRFNIGSVSKVIAALAAMILCDRARLALDEPIVTWLHDLRMLSPGYERITLRHLLSHASGLPGTNFRNVFSFAPLPGYAQDTLEGLKYYHLKHEPGELAVYCNDGFTLVECLVQAVTGLPYETFVQQEILAPLGMKHSAFALQPFPAGSVVIPYNEGRRTGQEFVNAYATGGLCTTPTDMMKLGALFLNGGEHEGRRIVSSRAILEMGTDQTGSLPLNPMPEWNWGLGWDHTRQPGLAHSGIGAWAKNGGTAFFATEFFVLPDQHMALLLTGAGRDFQARAIVEGVLLRALVRTRDISAVPPPIVPAAPPEATPETFPVSREGIYGSFSAPLKVVARGNAVDILKWEDGGWQPFAMSLTLRTDGYWWNDDLPAAGYGWTQAGGLDFLMTRPIDGAGHYRYTLPLAQRMPPLTTGIPPAWLARLGDWETINESPDSVAQLDPDPATLQAPPELAGYLLWSGGQLLVPDGDHHAGMAVKIPGIYGRDLVELHAEVQAGQETLRVGTLLYRRAATA